MNSLLPYALKGFLATFIALTLVVQPISQEHLIPNAEAGGFTGESLEITQLLNVATNTITSAASGASALLLGSLELKEYALDGIAWFVAKLALQSITSSLIQWINSGFEGRPAFVQDLRTYMIDIADQTIGQFIFDSEALSFLCSPFRIDVELALTERFARRMSDREDFRAQCTLSEVAENVENFLGGDFIGGGGWDSWYNMTQNPSENTALGQLYNLDTQLTLRIAEAEVNAGALLSFADGFLSVKECDDEPVPNCVITSPGKIISEALTFNLSIGPRVLIEADEIDEIIGALYFQLMNRAITGVGGLLGLTGDGPRPREGGSYLARMTESSRELAPQASAIFDPTLFEADEQTPPEPPTELSESERLLAEEVSDIVSRRIADEFIARGIGVGEEGGDGAEGGGGVPGADAPPATGGAGGGSGLPGGLGSGDSAPPPGRFAP